MKPKPAYNIWVYHRADGFTTFGEYIRVKRRVFHTQRLDDDRATEQLARRIAAFRHNAQREVAFQGDKLPQEFLDKLGIL